jgi:hypothetical protein
MMKTILAFLVVTALAAPAGAKMKLKWSTAGGLDVGTYGKCQVGVGAKTGMTKFDGENVALVWFMGDAHRRAACESSPLFIVLRKEDGEVGAVTTPSTSETISSDHERVDEVQKIADELAAFYHQDFTVLVAEPGSQVSEHKWILKILGQAATSPRP